MTEKEFVVQADKEHVSKNAKSNKYRDMTISTSVVSLPLTVKRVDGRMDLSLPSQTAQITQR